MSSGSDDGQQNQENKAIKEDLEAVESADVFPDPPTDTEASLNNDKIAQLEKDQLYLRAEFENYKRQAIKERSQLMKYGAERLARDLLDTLDVFTSALENEVTEENFKDFVKGIEMTQKQLTEALAKHGIQKVDCVGQPFDPNTQEALSSEASDKYPEGHVSQVFKAPYMYHDKLLRPGQVIVARQKAE
ncbi:MAG: nucleotide exchange factor GrpE [Bdellovibrionales bacterium]|nr:nucleotide exchange factor GrpE [Bdellovibrionales bacterium]